MSEAPTMHPVRIHLSDPSAEMLRRSDLRLVHPLDHETGDSRIVLVLDVDRANDVVDVALVHADPELATDSDVIVPKAAAATRFPIVVQSDLRSAVWRSQLGALVGRLATDQLEQVNDALDPEMAEEPSPFEIGLPLEGPFDGRWEFKSLEGAELRRLSADCGRALLEDDAAWIIDPRAIDPSSLGADRAVDVLIELMHWLQTRTLRLSETSYEFAVEVHASLTKDSWGEQADLAGELTVAFADLLMRPPVPKADGQRRALLTTASLPVVNDEFDVVRYLGIEMELV
jgi:hypothetical protein